MMYGRAKSARNSATLALDVLIEIADVQQRQVNHYRAAAQVAIDALEEIIGGSNPSMIGRDALGSLRAAVDYEAGTCR